MEIIPAIDVLDGKVVRLVEGDFERVTVYGDDPVAFAGRWVAEGARRLHLVDLAGARDGTQDLDLIRSVAAAGAAVQVGGGIRDLDRARDALQAGAGRVVVGTMAVHRPQDLADLVEAVGGERVVAAVDVRRGRAVGSGWVDDGRDLDEVLTDAAASGVAGVLVTGIGRDGTMTGPDLDLLRRARGFLPGRELIASGGIASVEDVDAAEEAGADAAVVGRALLEGAIRLR